MKVKNLKNLCLNVYSRWTISNPELPISNPELPMRYPECTISNFELSISNPELPISNPELPMRYPELSISNPELPMQYPEFEKCYVQLGIVTAGYIFYSFQNSLTRCSLISPFLSLILVAPSVSYEGMMTL